MFSCYWKSCSALKLITTNISAAFSNTSVSKSDLSKLRKISGFSFSKCKEALLKFNNNIEEAHNWLKLEAEKYGWNKMGKLGDRPMSNGLIGIQVNSISQNTSCGVMVEINCETDFVARNQSFHRFIHTATSAFMQNFSELRDIDTIRLNDEELNKLIYIDNDTNTKETINHLLAINVGSLGENMLLKRAFAIKADLNSYISTYSHLSWQDINKKWKETLLGKYGVIVKYRAKHMSVDETWKRNASHVTRQICQHIVGLNPVKIGNEEVDIPKVDVDSEDVLIYQQYLLDDRLKIKDILDENSIIIENFCRFNCGEEICN